MQWAVGGTDGEDSTLAKTGAGVLTFAAAGTFTATVAATGTVALGTGTNLQVGYWSGTNTLTSTANLVWNAGFHTLVANATIAVQGSLAGIDFYDRGTNADLWSIYSESNELRFWEDDSGLMYRMTTSAFFPNAAGAKDLGTASLYWNEVNYKLLTDRGCLGWYDDGVELQDGTLVSDVAALQAIRPHPYKRTPAGAARLDYATLPRHVYRPAPADEPAGEDGAETTALISILIGAIKELDARLAALEA
jgi:autotransporter-associated beta strand protein